MLPHGGGRDGPGQGQGRVRTSRGQQPGRGVADQPTGFPICRWDGPGESAHPSARSSCQQEGGRRSRVGGHRPCAREGPKAGRWPRVLLGGPCRDLPRPPPPPFCLGRRHRQPRAPGAPRDAQGWAASPRGPCRTSMRPEGGRGARGFCTAPCWSFFFSFIGKCFTPPY